MLTGDLFQPLTEKKKKPKPTKPDKWAYAKAEAKKKFDVYPSAYANAWAAKKYKELGGGWRMGEDSVEEAEDQKSDAGERSINDQIYVNLMRQAQELPVTGLNRDERIKLTLAKGLKKALDDTKKLQQATDSLERELVDIEDEHDEAMAAQGVDVKQAPAPRSDVQKTFNSVAASVNQAIQQTEDPKQKQELQREAERIKGLVRTAKLSNADVQKINKEVKAKGRNGFTAQELQRITDTIAQQAQQTKQEKTAAKQTQAVQQVAQPDPEQLKQVVDQEVEEKVNAKVNTVVPELVQQEINKYGKAFGQDVNVDQDENVISLRRAKERQAAKAQAAQAQAAQAQAAQAQATGTDDAFPNPNLQEQKEAETFDFRLAGARTIGIIDDFLSTNWDKAFKYFAETYKDEEGDDEDPWGESLTNLQNAFYVPSVLVRKAKLLAASLEDLEDYHLQIYKSKDYRSMFGQVMFPAFQGKLYNRQMKSPESKQDFENDLEFFVYYRKLLAKAIKEDIHPFMFNLNGFIKKEYAENTEDNHAMYEYYNREILQPYKIAIEQISQLANKLDSVIKLMQKVIPQQQPQQSAQGELFERKKKKKKSKSKKAFGGYYFPGYHYYGQGTAEISDGGGDGGGESMFEVVTKNRTPEETGSLDSYYSRRRQPHKVVDGKRVELTDREEIQQYLDAYENETDRKDYGDMSEQRLYFRTVATLAESLEQDFGMQQDDKGWYLTPRSGRQRILDAERAFGTPQVK